MTDEEPKAVEQVSRHVEAGDHAAALRLLAVRTWTVAEAYRLWTYALVGTRKFRAAVAKAREGLGTFRNDPDLWYALARALLHGRRYRAAAVIVERLVKEHGENGLRLRLWAESLRMSGRHRAALDLFEKVLQIDPAFVQQNPPDHVASYYNGWGNAHFMLRRYRDAKEKFATAIRWHSNLPAYWNNVAAAHFASDEWYEAVTAYRKALQLSTDDHVVVGSLAMSEWRAGLVTDAQEHFVKAKRALPANLGLRVMCCSALWRTGRYREARWEAHELRATYRQQREALLLARDVLDLVDVAEVFSSMLDDYDTADAALRDAQSAVENDFDFAERQLTTAVVAFARAEREVHNRRSLSQVAAAACRSAIHRMLARAARHRADPPVEAELQILGRAHLLLDDLAQAQKYLDAAVACPTPVSDTLIAYALVCVKRKDFVGAIRLLDLTLARDSEDVPTRVLLAEALHRAGELERSEAEARAVLRRAPGTVEAHLVLANVSIDLADKGDTDLYQQALTELDAAWQLAGTVSESKPFSAAAATRICYLRGYVRTRIYNDRQGSKDEWLLLDARSDFRKALDHDPESHHAAIALRKIDQRRREQRTNWINERLAGGTCALFALAIFGTAANQWALGLLSPGYAVPFVFGSMLFLIASFYLPQLLKLKVGSVELEKSAVEGAISKLPLQIRKVPGQ